ncbi:unnamed protein product [Prorocentrum cordatum]|uniref:Uncharacterized protein n=1 Tax=Prorocentrum cordatum TaxID=2364126 RepID=A0ABN9T2Z4_9DINO|nr:unnamed protein product [Polarella glacialis]
MLQLRTTPRECGLLWRAAASPHRRVRFWHAAGGAGSGPHSARWGGRSGREGRRRTMGRQENRRALRSLATARTRAGQASRVQLAGGSGASGERRRQRGKQEEDLLLGGSRPDALGAARGEPPGGPPGGEGPAHTAPPRGVGRLPPPPTGEQASRPPSSAHLPAGLTGTSQGRGKRAMLVCVWVHSSLRPTRRWRHGVAGGHCLARWSTQRRPHSTRPTSLRGPTRTRYRWRPPSWLAL